MSILKQRNRIVVFRLTDEEYESLKRASLRSGRTLSDFTRSELLMRIGHECPNPWQKLETIETIVRRMENLVARMARKPKGASKL
jgi:Mobilization protein NikA